MEPLQKLEQLAAQALADRDYPLQEQASENLLRAIYEGILVVGTVHQERDIIARSLAAGRLMAPQPQTAV